jgi:hypothetical protein
MDDVCISTNDSNYNTKFNYEGIHVLIEFPISHNQTPSDSNFDCISIQCDAGVMWLTGDTTFNPGARPTNLFIFHKST